MSVNSPKLWIVATPLGNHEDLSIRAQQVLESSDLVIAEDTRRAGILCKQVNIKVKRFVSYHEYNEALRLESIVSFLQEGKTVALISDAGTPVISDPGYLIVQACRKHGIPVSVVPGPCAIITALVASGIAPYPFTFLGFLPRRSAEQEKIFKPFISFPGTIVFFERKDRLVNTLTVAYDLLGPRSVCIARELTKIHEEYIFLTLGDSLKDKKLLGELTIVIGPSVESFKTEYNDILCLIDKEQKAGRTPKDIAKHVQSFSVGWGLKDLYNIVVARK